MSKEMTIEKIWKAIEQGKTVIWSSEAYEVHPVLSNGTKYSKPSEKGKYALRVTCISNWFGSLLHEEEIKACKILNRKPQIGWSEKDT